MTAPLRVDREPVAWLRLQTIRRSCLSLAVVAAVGACERRQQWKRTEVPNRVAEEIQGRRAVTTIGELDTLKPTTDFRLPDSLSSLYTLSRPIMLAVGDAPSCLVALGDIGDRAVHVFQSNGNYAFSFFGGARAQPEFGVSMLSSLASGRADEFVVSTVGGRVLAFDGTGQRTWAGQLQPARAAIDSGAGNQVVLGPDGLLYDAWFSGTGPLVRREQWANDRALVRVFDRTGRMIRRIGRVSEYPGEGLTYFLNRGYVQIFADTLWFARRADARILAFPLKGPYDAPARVLELPVYYRADAPIEDVSSDGSRVAVRIPSRLSTVITLRGTQGVERLAIAGQDKFCTT